MCFSDLDPAEFFQREERRARKPHRCSERGCEIPVGAVYEHVRAKWEGEIFVLKICAACQAIKAEIVRREIAAGCAESEAHPGYGNGRLADVLAEYEDDDRAAILAAVARPGAAP